MDICVDCETRGLSTKDFVAGCINTGKKQEIYYTKTEVWKRILEIGHRFKDKREVLNVYGHFHLYDFLCYADLKDRNLVIYSEDNPFILAYKDGREYIKFLDTFAIFPMSLKELGNAINLKKGELDENFKKDIETISISKLKDMIRFNIKGMRDYLIRDTEIPLKALDLLKLKLAKESVYIKRYYTAPQIAITYIMNKLSVSDKLDEKNFWYNKKVMKVYWTRYKEEIHDAYRGPRVESFRKGVFGLEEMKSKCMEKNIIYSPDKLFCYDINSLYPYSLCNIRMPNLRSERKIVDTSQYELDYLLDKIGIIRCILYNSSNDLGLIPVRTINGNYYPKKGKFIYGVYTNEEVRLALKEGYELLSIDWVILWDQMANPFKVIYERLYELRKNGIGFDNQFYKMILNSSIGKMAMLKPKRSYIIDSVDNAVKYLDDMYRIISARGRDYIYEKESEKIEIKNYYMPIIPCLVNSYSRLKMYKHMKENMENLVYTDTDNMILTKEAKNIKLGDRMGEWKTVCKNEPGIIYGRKTYMLGDEVKASGITRNSLDKDKFKDGFIKYKKMAGLRNLSKEHSPGDFYEESRDLYIQYHQGIEAESIIKDSKVYIDEGLLINTSGLDKLRKLMDDINAV